MNKLELINKLKKLNNNNSKIHIVTKCKELIFYIDKRDNAICVTTNSNKYFNPCSCYINNEETIKSLVDDTFNLFPEIKKISLKN